MVVERKDITEAVYVEIFQAETHHDHELLQDEEGIYRWKENKSVRKLVTEMNLNQIMSLFRELGLDKNSEIIRKMYRDMGYSLFGYWEIFYWTANNEIADQYKAPEKDKL